MSESQGCLYRSEVLLFGHIDLQRKPLFGNSKYIWGTLPRVWKIVLDICHRGEDLILTLGFRVILNEAIWAVLTWAIF